MENAIELHGLTKRYGALTAVDGIDLVVPAGEVLALLGPNGAGKSTTTEMVLGLARPDAGTVRVLGRTPVEAVRAGDIGAMLQQGALWDGTTVGRLLSSVRGMYAHPLGVDEVVELAHLQDCLRTKVEKLSGGQRQRVRFALALLGDPRLIILDEPTVGLDVESRRAFWATMHGLSDEGRTIVFATHYLDEADEFADRVVVMARGRVVADGTGAEIRSVVAGREVRFRPGAHADWAELPGVAQARTEGDVVVLSCTDSDACLRTLMTHDVADVEVTAPSLEDAFVRLTHDAEEHAA